MIHVMKDVGMASKASQLEETDIGVFLRLGEEKVVEGTLGDSFAPLRQEEVSSSSPVSDVSPTDRDKGKGTVDKGDELGFYMDLDGLG